MSVLSHQIEQYFVLEKQILECKERMKTNKAEQKLLKDAIQCGAETYRSNGEKSMAFDTGTVKWMNSTSLKIGVDGLAAEKEEVRIIQEIIDAGRSEGLVKITRSLDKVALKKQLDLIEDIEGLSLVKRESFSIVHLT